jgi:hypothetical protein
MENREPEDLAHAIRILIERHRASFSDSDIETLEEALRRLEDLQHQHHGPGSVDLIFRAAAIVARIMEAFGALD